MTRNEAETWFKSPCPATKGHEAYGIKGGIRWQKGDCHTCVVEALVTDDYGAHDGDCDERN